MFAAPGLSAHTASCVRFTNRPGFLQGRPRSGKELQQSLISLCSWFGAKLRIILSVSFSFPLTPPEEQHRLWDHKYIYELQNHHGESGGVKNMFKSVSQTSEMTSPLIWSGSPWICCFCFIFDKLILTPIFWKPNLGKCCPEAKY